ncbi:MAG: hypothetical protein ACRC3H_13180 [Lachnospiraceae bacterium]
MSGNYATVTNEKWDCRVKEVGTAEVHEFYDWLQGEITIDRMTFAESPKLSKEAAFAVIYYLQERLGVIEDNYELCRGCGRIYDSYGEGTYINEESTIVEDGKEIDANFPEEMYGSYCNYCRPD